MFIRIIQGRATNPPGIRRDLRRWQRLLAADADGWLGTTTGITDDGWSVTVVRFTSAAQARRNSERPEQREWWRDASQHLARVAVHDAPTVHIYRDGGADEASFVQVIQGHSAHLQPMAGLGRDQEEVLARNAPHVLGITVAEHAEWPGDFTQIVYFTSEQDARRFSQEPPAVADEPVVEQLRSLMTNARCFDLRDPQLLSPSDVYTYQRDTLLGTRHDLAAGWPRGQPGKVRAMPIEPAQLASSLGALGSLDVEQGLAVTLPQVLGSAKALLDADRAVLMLIDQTGALRWASASGPGGEAVAGDLSVPVEVGGGPVGTLDVYVTAPREWDDSAAAALQAYAGLVASLLVATVTARQTGRLADQLQAALEHRSLIEQAAQLLVDREHLDPPAALEWLEASARSSRRPLVKVAHAVLGGMPLPSDRLAQAKAQRRKATDLAVAAHRRDSELHEGEARRYERRGQPGRAQTERLQAAAARGRIIDAEAEQRRADQQP